MNYIGSKKSLLPFITGAMKTMCGEELLDCTFADLFSGTGVVSLSFVEDGCYVISNDIMYYAYTLSRGCVERGGHCHAEKFIFEDIDSLIQSDHSGLDNYGTVSKNYCNGGRRYFTKRNGNAIDAIRGYIESICGCHISKGDQVYTWLIASLLESADRVANTASTYTSYLKEYKESALKPIIFYEAPRRSPYKCNGGKAYNEDANELIRKISGDILYLDPPYNERQYSSYYHVLETIARGDNPEIHGVTGQRDDLPKSKWCSKKEAPKQLDDMLANADFKYIFLSYNNEGLMSLETIREIMEKYGKYEVFTCPHRRFKQDSNRKCNADFTTEYLHCCIK